MKLKKTWVKKIILLVVAAAMVAAYFFVPGIHSTVLKIFKMCSCERICGILWGICGGDFLCADDFPVGSGTSSGISSDLCKCKSVWLVAGCASFVEQCNGRSGSMFFHCKNSG